MPFHNNPLHTASHPRAMWSIPAWRSQEQWRRDLLATQLETTMDITMDPTMAAAITLPATTAETQLGWPKFHGCQRVPSPVAWLDLIGLMQVHPI